MLQLYTRGNYCVQQECSDGGGLFSAYDTAAGTRRVPAAARRKLAQFVDVFCDKGAFTVEEAEQIFAAAKDNGLSTRAHIGQLSETALTPLLCYNPASFDHMDHVNDGDIAELAARDTVATLVPGANYFLGLNDYPNARRLIDAGVAVALATDYNPGTSPTVSMPMAMSLACTHMKMSPAEAIAAGTINGAWALRPLGLLTATNAGEALGRDAAASTPEQVLALC